MKKQEQVAFTELLHQVMSLYSKPVSAFLVEVFWSGLKSYPLAEVRQALHAHCTHPDTGMYPPKPCEIIRHLSGTSQERALLAWSKVQDAIPRVGSYRSVVFDDAWIHLVMGDMGGWAKLCRCTEHDLTFRAQEFQKRYASYASRNTVPPYPSVLKGRQEGRDELPVFVGDKLLAKQVYANGETESQVQHHSLTLDEIAQIQRNLEPPKISNTIVTLASVRGEAS